MALLFPKAETVEISEQPREDQQPADESIFEDKLEHDDNELMLMMRAWSKPLLEKFIRFLDHRLTQYKSLTATNPRLLQLKAFAQELEKNIL